MEVEAIEPPRIRCLVGVTLGGSTKLFGFVFTRKIIY